VKVAGEPTGGLDGETANVVVRDCADTRTEAEPWPVAPLESVAVAVTELVPLTE